MSPRWIAASLFAAVLAALVLAACGAAPPTSRSEVTAPAAALLGGAATVFDASQNAFGLPAPGLEGDDYLHFFVGNSFFKQNWVSAPASAAARDGLGPLFNARSCGACHLKDGRGRPPETGRPPAPGLLVRLSVPGKGPRGGPLSEPRYGGQLQDLSLDGVPTEGRIRIELEEVAGRFDDGTPYTLVRPRHVLTDLAHGPLHPQVMTSPRVAPQVIGMGLLEAVPEELILSRADPDDGDGDGISGRANRVWDALAGATALGRFGWKANQPSVAQQVAGAFLGDMGITTPLNGDENCTAVQHECASSPHGGAPELPQDDFDKVVLYTQALAVPARRDLDAPLAARGEELFTGAGCAECHVPVLTTGPHAVDALSHQTIRPYTDLLLHDMGEELADGRPDFEASGSEWRTPPLWGLGLIPVVNGHDRLLHDGRARGVMEAVLWHGGEAEAAKRRVLAFDAGEREALERFLTSL